MTAMKPWLDYANLGLFTDLYELSMLQAYVAREAEFFQPAQKALSEPAERRQVVLELNWQALDQLRCEKRLETVPGARHLFEEPGAPDQVIELARDWFKRDLTGRSQAS